MTDMSTLHERLAAADPLRAMPPDVDQDAARRRSILNRVLAEAPSVTVRPDGSAGLRGPRRRLAVALSAAAAVLSIAGTLFVWFDSEPAYAVERLPDGTIKIRINEYRDPKGLQRRLERLGVKAVIDYLPFGTTCREPRADFEPDNSDLFAWSDLEPGAKSAPLLLRADRIKPGQTLVFVAWLEEWGAEHASVSIGLLANGPVKPCERIPGGPNLTPDGRLQPEGAIEPTR